MLKQFLNTGSLKSLMLFEKDADGNEIIIDPKVALREQIAKGNLPASEVIVEKEEDDGEKDEESEEGDDEENDDGDGKKEKEELTPEQIKEKEANEKVAAKAQRKQDRMQARIDRAVAEKRAADTEIANLKAQLAANPDQKLTAEEVETRAKAIAAQTIKEKEIADIQTKFDNDCAVLQKAASKLDKEFDDKIKEVAEQFGPIPSVMIGVLTDLENGAEVLAHFANDEDFAEEIYNSNFTKMTRKLVELSNELIAAKKKPKKEISRVEAGVDPVKASTVKSTVITQADTRPENMENYVAKRRAQMEQARKIKGF